MAALASDTGALAQTLDAFAASFGALAGLLLAAPVPDVQNRVREPELLAQWPLKEQPDCQRGISLLLESGANAESVEVIHRDYNELYVGPHRVKVSPYESVHRSAEGLLFDEETLQVRDAYAGFGLVAPKLNKEPDDHLGLELGFVSTLCVRGLEAIEAKDQSVLVGTLRGLLAFLDEHLLVWAPDCFARTEKVATTSFYQGVGALGSGTCLAAEAILLSETHQPSPGR
ncbi:TorD/DmsD family molecular chaperone [Sanguibacter gelidistatuariae]|uniref:TorD/DmsD family molecular chaperone n=1 Tax=Sanguibacter gelidistatuariae TaxID=1814289 RepID=UPI00158814B9|nr:molecular chaperone TorD family protein [Sanguibacter gelidistatuariae]